jgi:hypothetical protein
VETEELLGVVVAEANLRLVKIMEQEGKYEYIHGRR